MKQSLKVLLGAAMIAGLSVAAQAAVIYKGTSITAYDTWTAGNTYVLTNILYVSNNAILTIQPGTVVRGEPESVAGAYDPGTLVICRGSKIMANGTAANPIVFTDLQDPTVLAEGGFGTGSANTYTNPASAQTAQWGGIVLLGKTYIADNRTTPDATREKQIEGLTATGSLGYYGPNGTTHLVNDDDHSGEMSYVSVRFGGFNLTANNEINGVTFGGVGRGTKIHHIEVVNTLDDAFEWFGGTVNCRYLAAIRCGDDSFDIDEGYRGKMQFLFGLQGVTSAGGIGSGYSQKGMELDGGNSPDQSQPFGISSLYNVTCVGNGKNGDTYENSNMGFCERDNAGVRIYNSLFLDFGGRAVALDCKTSNSCEQRLAQVFGNVAGSVATNTALYPDYTLGGYELEIKNNIFYRADNWLHAVPADMGSTYQTDWTDSFGPNPSGERDTSTQSGNSATLNAAVFGTGTAWATNNVITSTLPITSLARDTSIPSGNVQPILTCNPLPVGAALSTPSPAPADGFFSPVNFNGAFSPTYNWLQGWSFVNTHMAIVPTISNPSSPSTTDLTLLSSVSFDTVNGVTYVIEASSNMTNWTPIASVTGNGTTMSYVDTRALSTRQFYRVVVQ